MLFNPLNSRFNSWIHAYTSFQSDFVLKTMESMKKKYIQIYIER